MFLIHQPLQEPYHARLPYRARHQWGINCSFLLYWKRTFPCIVNELADRSETYNYLHINVL